MTDSTQQIIAEIRARLRAARRRLLLARLARGMILGIVVGVSAWLVLAGAEVLLRMPPSVRIALVGTLTVAATLLLVRYILDPVARLLGVVEAPRQETVAHIVETRVPSTRDRLLNVLDLAGGRHTESPSHLVDGAIRLLGEPISTASFEHVEDFARVRRGARFAAIPLLGLAIVLLAAPGPFFGATSRLIHPGRSYTLPARFSLVVTPGSAEIIRGDSLRMTAEISGAEDVIPRMEFRRAGERSVSAVRPVQTGQGLFVHVATNIRQNFSYRAVAEPVTSDWYSVTVMDRPVVRHLRVTVISPRYSRTGRMDLGPNVGDVTALPGSRVILKANLAGATAAGAWIVFNHDSRLDLNVENGVASGEFTLTRAGTYHIELLSENGVPSTNPISYRLDLLTDEFPSVVIVDPDQTTELVDPFEPSVTARITDDYGFRRMSLMYRLAQSRFGAVSESFVEVPIESIRRSELDQVIRKDWRMRQESGLSPVPGDIFEYFVRVWDNDTYRGYKSADSQLHQFVLPSLADRFREAREEAEDATDDLERLLDETRDVEDRFDELRDELRQKPEAGWDDSRQLEQIEELQQQVEEGLDEVADQIDDLARQMEENDLLSEETMNAYEELQRTIEEINSPELMEALQKLRDAMQSMDLQQMQQAMQDFDFNEDQFRERLERAIDLFKRLKAQQGLEEAARRAEELAAREEEIEDETRRLDDGEQEDTGERRGENEDPGATDRDAAQASEDLARQQEEAEREMRSLQEHLKEVQEMLDEIPRVPSEQLEEIRSRLERQDMPGEMQRNAEQLRNQQLGPAMQSQQQMQQQLQNLQQQLTDMQQGMEGRQLQLNIAGLRQALNDVLVLSHQQEEAMAGVSAASPDSPALRGYARKQTELGEGLQVVADTLRQLAREVPEMSREVQTHTGSALREMGKATDALADRSARRASGHQKASMMHLNELALLLSDLLNMLMNQQMSMGMPSMQQMLQQMQQMAGQQQQLNQQIQEMLNNMQGQRLTQDMQERMRQLAQQQEQIRQQLKELSRNPELRGNAMGDLNRIAEQMQETIRELQQFRNDRNLMQRQQQIHTRLLDASRSMNTRGRERRRESRTGDDVTRQSPGDFTPDERADQLRRDLIRALESGYAPDYEELIKRYFELLQEARPAPPTR